MKTVLIFMALVALAAAGTIPPMYHHHVKTKPVDATFVEHQKKILGLFYNVMQVDVTADYYKAGKDYDVAANMDNYSNKEAVEYFLKHYKSGFLPKYRVFSIFHDEIREQAISLFQLFYYAKDFDTLYKTASFARIHVNQGMFLYSLYVAVLQRDDTFNYVLPAPYEIYPELFINMRENYEMYRTMQENGLPFPEIAKTFGVVQEKEDYVFYANYSDTLTYPHDEQRLAYFTEDVGLNSYYYYYHVRLPFWWTGHKYQGYFQHRRGEYYFYFYQQLLARYYLERLSNGLGEIPSFSWYSPIRTGYYPMLSTFMYPLAQRSNHYMIHNEHNYEEIRFLDIFEKSFFQYLQSGHFKTFDQEIDFQDPKAVNFVGNYWATCADLFGVNFTHPYQRSYDITARHILSGAPKPFDKYNFLPSALDFYQSTLRDPVSYQLYNKIFDYMVQYKEYLKHYTHEDLHFKGVKINDVKVDKLETFFELYDFEAINAVFLGKDDARPYPHDYKIRQPRLNHKPFTVSVDLKSDVESEALFKIWIGPKYDSNGFPISFENNWMNFVELDWFHHKLAVGENKIVRNSDDFYFYKEDSLPITEIWKLLDEGKLPKDMSEEYDSMPKRLMLPRGTKGGYPYQLFVCVFPLTSASKEFSNKLDELQFLLGNKSFGFPLDRPVMYQYFKQPNMFFEDVAIYHEGDMHTYSLVTPHTWKK